jgi:hypothetical protein
MGDYGAIDEVAIVQKPPELPPPAWGDVKKYEFDTWYTSSPTAQYVLLFWVNIFCIIVLFVLFTVTGTLADKTGIEFVLEMTWLSWGQLFDGIGGSPDGYLWGTRFVGLVVTFMGMFVFGLVCSFVEDAINSKLDALRRGKSRVLEEGFVLIIGWNPRILPLVQQLILASEGNGGTKIVVLSEEDKPTMDEFWMDEVPAEDRAGTAIITRQGSAIQLNNLEKCSARKARSVVILAPNPFSPQESDANVTRIMIALTGESAGHGKGPALGWPQLPGTASSKSGLTGHVVCELCDIDNKGYVHLALPPTNAGRQMRRIFIKPVVANDFTGRLMIQCALQPGLARVFTHILAFEKNEFYFKEWPQLVRRRFADCCFMFEAAVPFGIHLKDPVSIDGREVRIMLNPPGDQLIEDGDEIIVIAEDDNSYEPGDLNMVDPGSGPEPFGNEIVPKHLMLIGMRNDLDDMINEIDKWVPTGSTLTLFSPVDIKERMEILDQGGLIQPFTHLQPLINVKGNPVLLRDLERALGPSTQPNPVEPDFAWGDRRAGGSHPGLVGAEPGMENPAHFDGIIVLTTMDDAGQIPMNQDSRTLVTALLIRDIQKRCHYRPDNPCGPPKTVVAEILDPRTEKLLKLAKLDDFISSNDLVSMALGQIAEESDIHGLLDDIFSPEGNEMYIKDIRVYAHEGETLNFWDLTARARMHGEVCMGWIRPEESKDPILNPGNEAQADLFGGDKRTKLTWFYGHKLIVFSEGDADEE